MKSYIDTVDIGGRHFRVERAKNLDELVDEVSDDLFNEDERLPYWAELWPCARAMSLFILQNPQLINGHDVLELGCGLGLTTMALARCNPSSLVATDYEQGALDVTARNFEHNKLSAPELRLLDWRLPELERRFPLIVASDVAYEQRFFEPLVDLFRRHLSEGGEVLLAEPNRSVARSFFGKLSLSGFCYRSMDITVLQDGHEIRVTIYRIRRA